MIPPNPRLISGYTSEVTLRDLFAAAVYGALYLDGRESTRGSDYLDDTPEEVAREAYRHADALLAERAK